MIVIVDGDDDDVSVASVLPDKVEKVAGVIDVPPPVGDVVVLADNINIVPPPVGDALVIADYIEPV
jgi:hypothetical protein